MKIEKLSSDKLKISLTCTEMLQFNPELYPEETTRLLGFISKELEQEPCFSVLNQKILLEMIPSPQEGCEIYVTKVKPHTVTKKEKKQHLLIFAFIPLDALRHAIEQISVYLTKDSTLYRMNGKFYLTLPLSTKEDVQSARMLLSDLGECMSMPHLFESVLTEYAARICSGVALNQWNIEEIK